MPGVHDELTFESAIEHHLIANRYVQGSVVDYDPSLAVDSKQLLTFIEATQAEEWDKLVQLHGEAEARSKFLNRLQRELGKRGSLDVLRRGVTDLGVKFRLAYFKPAASFGPDLVQLYEANRLSVTRQVPLLSAGGQAKTVDLVLFVNGIPVATAELKNPTTGQTYRNAIKQYRTDRNPKDPLFAYPTRALVHFAVDPDEVHMTTRLALSRTRFLPFNRGRDGGAGNPDNPNGYKTAYLWEEVLQRGLAPRSHPTLCHDRIRTWRQEGPSERDGDLPPLPPTRGRATAGSRRQGVRSGQELPRHALHRVG